jgi:hypothetical protein
MDDDWFKYWPIVIIHEDEPKMSEKIVVEFEVTRAVEHGDGLVSKYLKFRGEPTGYKAIVKDDDLIAIVRQGYTVVPNRAILRALREIGLIDDERVKEWWDATKLLLRIPIEEGYELLVANSEDASMALNVTLSYGGMMVTPLHLFALAGRSRSVKYVRKRHVGRLGVKLVVDAVNSLRELVKEYGKYLKTALEFKVEPPIDEILRNADLPKKYRPEVQEGIDVGVWFGEATRRIWSANLRPNVRYVYLSRLSDALASIILTKVEVA